MEIEELKGKMDAAGAGEAVPRSADELEKALGTAARRFRRASRMGLAMEFAGVGLVYGFVLVYVFILGKPLISFQLKLLAVSVAGVIALSLLFARFFARSRTQSLALPALEHLRTMLALQKRLLWSYEATAYAACAAYAVLFWTDSAFRALTVPWKAGTMIYLIAVAAVVRPYLRSLYGRPIKSLEDQIRGWIAID